MEAGWKLPGLSVVGELCPLGHVKWQLGASGETFVCPLPPPAVFGLRFNG